jgi:hypothetical protein
MLGLENIADTPAISFLMKLERFPFAHPLADEKYRRNANIASTEPIIVLPAVLDSTKQMAGEIAVLRGQMQAIEEAAIQSQCDIEFVRAIEFVLASKQNRRRRSLTTRQAPFISLCLRRNSNLRARLGGREIAQGPPHFAHAICFDL